MPPPTSRPVRPLRLPGAARSQRNRSRKQARGQSEAVVGHRQRAGGNLARDGDSPRQSLRWGCTGVDSVAGGVDDFRQEHLNGCLPTPFIIRLNSIDPGRADQRPALPGTRYTPHLYSGTSHRSPTANTLIGSQLPSARSTARRRVCGASSMGSSVRRKVPQWQGSIHVAFRSRNAR